MKHGTADHLSRRPHPQPLSHLMGEGGVGLSPARRGGEGNAGLGIDARAPGGLVLTRAELAAALQVSVRTVDRMVTAGDIPVMELGEDLVRFYLLDVLEALRSGKRKHGRKVGPLNIEHSTSNIEHPTSN